MLVMELLDLLRGKLENIANTLLDHQQTVWSFCFVGIVRIFVYYNFVTQLTIFFKVCFQHLCTSQHENNDSDENN